MNYSRIAKTKNNISSFFPLRRDKQLRFLSAISYPIPPPSPPTDRRARGGWIHGDVPRGPRLPPRGGHHAPHLAAGQLRHRRHGHRGVRLRGGGCCTASLHGCPSIGYGGFARLVTGSIPAVINLMCCCDRCDVCAAPGCVRLVSRGHTGCHRSVFWLGNNATSAAARRCQPYCADWLFDAKMQIWQVLPLVPPGRPIPGVREVGGCTRWGSNRVDPIACESVRFGFNPCAYEVK